MATFNYQEITYYVNAGPYQSALGVGQFDPASSIGDGTPTDDYLSSTDTLVYSTSSFTATPPWIYLGYTEIDGVQYPVIQLDDGRTAVFGTVLDSSTYPDLASLNIQSTQMLTCFAEGTQIAIPGGHAKVESLQIDDRVVTEDGRAVPVKWIGRQTVATRFGPGELLMPVRFIEGALGNGLPHTDLTVTADHGMLVDGVICHAGALVNGTTITRVPLAEMGESYTVYHIETEEHEIILANGAPAETFIDNVSRRVFDNFAEFEALYGDVPEMEELDYPRAMSVRQVPARIAARLNGALAA